LVVVVALMGVLAGLIVPRLAGSLRPRMLSSAATRMVAAARYARDYAATHRRCVRLLADARTGRVGLLVQVDPRRDEDRYEPIQGPGRPERLPEGVTIQEVRVSRAEPVADGTQPSARDSTRPPDDPPGVTFYPDGRADAALIQLTDGQRVLTLLIAPRTGRAKLVRQAVRRLPDERVDLDA
jgi:type II secretory pathway pseudopilin PulG